jgi:hypothetical protein
MSDFSRKVEERLEELLIQIEALDKESDCDN